MRLFLNLGSGNSIVNATMTIGSGSDAAATDLTLQFGGTNAETIKFLGATTDLFDLTDSINIPTGEKYKINGVDLNFSDLAGTLGDAQITAGAVDLDTSEVAGVLPNANVADDLTIVAGTINNTPIGATTASTGKFTTLDAAGNISMRKGDKLLLDSDDTTVDTYLIRNTGATTVSWFVDGVEIAVLKKQTEVR